MLLDSSQTLLWKSKQKAQQCPFLSPIYEGILFFWNMVKNIVLNMLMENKQFQLFEEKAIHYDVIMTSLSDSIQ